MSSDFAHSTVSYTSISSEARSWSIPTVDPYVEATRHALEQASPPLSPAHIADADPKEDPKEDPTYYHVDGGDDDDEPSGDNADDKDVEEDDDEEEEYLALANSSAVPTVDPIPSAEDTKAFETDESAPTPPSPKLHRAGISVRLPPPMTASVEARIAEIQLRDASPLPLSAPSSPLLPPATGRREDILKADVPPQKRLCLTTPTSRFEIGESSIAAARQLGSFMARRADYSFVDTMDASI
ncbi:hypothetical protein Tco_1266192 [Tanacetum coccineum]